MRILWLDAFHAGSHKAVSTGYAAHSTHQVTVIGLPQDGGWRWRMRGAALSFVRMVRERYGDAPLRQQFDVLVVTDMCDVATLLGVGRRLFAGLPVALYMHENQLTYPLPAGRKLDLTWPWINYTSMVAADLICFNSEFHRQSLLTALPGLPRRFHDYHELDVAKSLDARSCVLYPGIDLHRLDAADAPAAPKGAPTVLWNSRWDYDKQPLVFLEAVSEVIVRGHDIRLIVLGEYVDQQAEVFEKYRQKLAAHTIHWGYVPDMQRYCALLHQADIVVSAAIQEFFGIAVIEAAYAGAVPLLPRRLTYPELLPTAYHADCLYDDDAQLADGLVRLLQRHACYDRQELRAWALRFDWQSIAPKYDEILAGMV
jgi:glycosyltransferase involved in cell wall biosynthesis